MLFSRLVRADKQTIESSVESYEAAPRAKSLYPSGFLIEHESATGQPSFGYLLFKFEFNYTTSPDTPCNHGWNLLYDRWVYYQCAAVTSSLPDRAAQVQFVTSCQSEIEQSSMYPFVIFSCARIHISAKLALHISHRSLVCNPSHRHSCFMRSVSFLPTTYRSYKNEQTSEK
jgi:hypothetical protein